MKKKKKIIGMYGGSFNPLHNGHVKCIRKALSMCDELHLVVGDLPNRDIFNFYEKVSWLVEIFHDESIIIHRCVDDSMEKQEYTLDKWISDSVRIKKLIGKPIDIVFCGADYNRPDNPYIICYPDSKIAYFDREDQISSSEFLKDPEAHKDWVPDCVYRSFLNYRKGDFLCIE